MKMKINLTKNNFAFRWNYNPQEATKYPNHNKENANGRAQRIKEENLALLRADILGLPKYEAQALPPDTISALLKFQKRTNNMLSPKRKDKNDSKNLGINSVKNRAQGELLEEAVKDLKSAQRIVNNCLEDFGSTFKTNSKKLCLVRLVDRTFRHLPYYKDDEAKKIKPIEIDGQMYSAYYKRTKLSYVPDFFVENLDNNIVLRFDATSKIRNDENYILKEVITPKYKIKLKDDNTIKSLEVDYDEDKNGSHKAKKYYSFLDSQNEFVIRENCKIEEESPKSSEGFYVFNMSDGTLNYFRKKGFDFLGLDCAFSFSKEKGWQAKILE